MKIKTNYLFYILICAIVFVFFAHTLNYPWKHFDEQIIYNETLFPIPDSFLQISEYLNLCGSKNYIEASNPFYSNIANLRTTPVFFNLITLWAFKKSALNYHLFMLLLHTVNALLCFLIINKVSYNYKPSLVFALTLIWALHPANVESILLPTNFGAILTYFFCLVILLYFIKAGEKGRINSFFVFFLYLVPLYLNEYAVTLPFILFSYLYSHSLLKNPELKIKDVLTSTFNKLLPVFIALFIFTIQFFTIPKINIDQATNLPVTIERIFWLAPQIFFHFLKLIFFPVHLSLDQSSFVKISNSLFETRSTLCFLLMYGLILISIISFFKIKEKLFFYFFIFFVPFFLSLLPFLHIISPVYNLASERYLYLPSFFIVLGLAHVLFSAKSYPNKIIAITIFISILFLVGFRSYTRTLDWKDSVSLFTSAYTEAKQDLFKALRLEMLGSILSTSFNDKESITKGNNYIYQGKGILEKSIVNLEEEKKQFKNKLPQVIKVYGLDPKSIQAKTAYLLAFTKLGLGASFSEAYEILKPHMQDKSIIDTQILNFYLSLLFSTNNLEEAEKLLNYALKNKPSPNVFVALSELYKNKYRNFVKAESYLKDSFKYFPYDTLTLESLKIFYSEINRPNDFALYSYLYGMRIHSKKILEEAYKTYNSLNNEKMANKVLTMLKKVENKSSK